MSDTHDKIIAAPHPEIKRDDVRAWRGYLADPDFREFMRVGVAGDRPVPDAPPVPYGDGRHFPADTVISLGEVRQLMIDFFSPQRTPVQRNGTASSKTGSSAAALAGSVRKI